MDSTPTPTPTPTPTHTPTPTPTPTPNQPHDLISLHPSPRKLPIKRKTPESSTSPNPNPNNSPPILNSPITPTTTDHGGEDDDLRRRPPFKFHRIWTEPDEIRFLRGLLDCSSESLSFPRDLQIFFDRFSHTMSQPYSKSQLSEKLRRLRKKWRAISARLAKGLDESRLSPHDRALFDLSKQLWHPDYSSTSPFGGGGVASSNFQVKASKLVGVKVSFSPSIPVSNPIDERNESSVNYKNDVECNGTSVDNKIDVDCKYGDDSCYEEMKLNEVNVELEEDCLGEENKMRRSNDNPVNEIGKTVAKAVVNVFDQSLKDVMTRKRFPHEVENKDLSFEKRWRELRVAEMEVFAQRLRLVAEDSFQRRLG